MFMRPEILRDAWYRIDGTQGIVYVPCFQESETAYDESIQRWRGVKYANEHNNFDSFQEFYPGEIWEVEYIPQGYGTRLAAPGYLDCTEWMVFNSLEEAKTFLEEQYNGGEGE